MTRRIFVSSVQREFAEERRAIADFVQGDPLLRRFFTVFLCPPILFWPNRSTWPNTSSGWARAFET
jgi:hypothetical protein